MEKIIKNLDSNKAHRSDMLQICIKSKIKPLLIIYKHLYKHPEEPPLDPEEPEESY